MQQEQILHVGAAHKLQKEEEDRKHSPDGKASVPLESDQKHNFYEFQTELKRQPKAKGLLENDYEESVEPSIHPSSA